MNEAEIESRDKDRLELTQSIRNKFMKQISKEDEVCEKDQNFLVNLLNGSDKAILQKQKNIIDKESNQNNGELKSAIADMLKDYVVDKNNESLEKTIPEIDTSKEIYASVPGEDQQGVPELNFKKFTKEKE